MGRSSRTKGASGEREVAAILRTYGYEGKRTAQLQTYAANDAADVAGLPGHHIEVKRQERVCMDEWCQQAERDAEKTGTIPVVIWRRSRQPWRVTLPLAKYLELLEDALIPSSGSDVPKFTFRG